MKTQSGNFTAQDGTSIYWKGWTPDKAPKAVVHVIHGYAEHIDRYGNVVGELLPAGYAVFGTDHRGHGKSEGKRGHVKSFQEFIDDEKQFWHNIIQTKFPGIPYFVLGHSMGSLIAMNYVEQNAVGMKGLILSGTGSLPGKDNPKDSSDHHQDPLQNSPGRACKVASAAGVHFPGYGCGQGIH